MAALPFMQVPPVVPPPVPPPAPDPDLGLGAFENVFSFMLNTTDAYIASFINSGVTAMQGEVALIIGTIMTLYIAIYGWMILFGHSEGNMNDLTRTSFKMVLVWALATQALPYTTYVQDFLWRLPEGVASVLLNIVSEADASVENDISGLSAVMEIYNNNVAKITEKVSRSGKFVAPALAGLLALIMQVPIIAALFIVLISKVGLAIMLVLGPFFIITSLFGLTKGIFEGWLRQSLTFIVMAILAYAIIALLMSMLNDFGTELADESGALKFAKAVPLALVAFVAAIIFVQIPSFATGIAGGMGLSDLGAVSGGAKAAGRAGKAGANAAGARAGRAISRSGGAIAQATLGSRAAASARTNNLLAKKTPRLHSAIQTAKEVGASASSGAKKADFYSGGKNARDPNSKTATFKQAHNLPQKPKNWQGGRSSQTRTFSEPHNYPPNPNTNAAKASAPAPAKA